MSATNWVGDIRELVSPLSFRFLVYEWKDDHVIGDCDNPGRVGSMPCSDGMARSSACVRESEINCVYFCRHIFLVFSPTSGRISRYLL